jgi:hypothetical protein
VSRKKRLRMPGTMRTKRLRMPGTMRTKRLRIRTRKKMVFAFYFAPLRNLFFQ